MAKQNKIIQSWKLGGWQHPVFQHIITVKRSEERGTQCEGVPVQRMVVLLGGQTQLKEVP